MELWIGWSCLLVVLIYGAGFSSALVRPRRQSDTWWRSYQPGWGSPRGLGQSASGVGSPRGSSWYPARGAQPVSGWGSRFPGRDDQTRQLPPSPSSPISVQCGEDRMVVMVKRDFYGNGKLVKPSDLTLGSCRPGVQTTDTMVVFENGLQECGSSLEMTADFLLYETILTYRPTPGNVPIIRTNPAAVPIQCVYFRHGNVSSKAIKPTWAPFSTTVTSEERLAFSLNLMTDGWGAPRTSSVFQLGDMFYIEASVDTQNHIPMMLFVDSCVATTTSNVNSNPRYEFIAYNGCLVDGKEEDASSAFRSPRLQPDKLQFMVDAFRFTASDVSLIYITCQLRAVAASQVPDPKNKACSYSKTSSRWSPVEGSAGICQCCDTGDCDRLGSSIGMGQRIGKREIAEGSHHSVEHGLAVLGPLLVTGPVKESPPVSEHLQASRMMDSAQVELWVLVSVCSFSLVVLILGLALTVKCAVKKHAKVLTVQK